MFVVFDVISVTVKRLNLSDALSKKAKKEKQKQTTAKV